MPYGAGCTLTFLVNFGGPLVAVILILIANSQISVVAVTKNTFREIIYTSDSGKNFTWPRREQVATIPGNVTIGGLMMVHERDEAMICGKIMPQGGLQATEAMLYTVNKINELMIIPGIQLAARIKDDCDRDIYGLEQSVDFIRGKSWDRVYLIDICKVNFHIPSKWACTRNHPCISYLNLAIRAYHIHT